MKKYGKDTIQCLESDVKLKVSLARHEKAGSRAEAGVARLEGHSLKHREVLQLITVNRYGMVWYGMVGWSQDGGPQSHTQGGMKW